MNSGKAHMGKGKTFSQKLSRLIAPACLLGSVGCILALPPYSIQVPKQVDLGSTESTGVPFTVTNMSAESLELTWPGDCCSLSGKLEVPPFSRRTARFKLTVQSDHRIVKIFAPTVKRSGKMEELQFPYECLPLGYK